MDNDRVLFLRAENGIIVELYHRTWDGSGVERHLFPYSPDKWDGDVLAEAINFAFSKRIQATSLLNIQPADPIS